LTPLAVLVLLATVGVPAAPAAPPPAPPTPTATATPTLAGTYALDPSRSDDVTQAIEKTVGEVSFFIRSMARGRLTKTNKPYQRVILALSTSQVSIVTDVRAPIVTQPDGTPVKWTREDGEIFDVSTVWDGQALRQTFQAEDGQRVNEYRPASDGGMVLQATISSKRLATPLQYRLVYTRVQ
jgi:hypothetical protein